MLLTTRKCLLEMVRRATHLSVISFNTGVEDYTFASFSILCMFMYCLRIRKKKTFTRRTAAIVKFQVSREDRIRMNCKGGENLDRFVLFHVLFSCVFACAVPSLLPHLLFLVSVMSSLWCSTVCEQQGASLSPPRIVQMWELWLDVGPMVLQLYFIIVHWKLLFDFFFYQGDLPQNGSRLRPGLGEPLNTAVT